MTSTQSISMKIAFRVDASLQIGTGHVMRCLTLAAALRERGATCVFLCRPHEGHLLDLIVKEGHSVLALPYADSEVSTEADTSSDSGPAHASWLGTGWADDARHSRQALTDHMNGMAVDWLVVDHYALDARWEAALRPACSRLMVIDDLADRPHDCDLLLDQNLGRAADDYDGLLTARTTMLIGPQFALLRPEFARLRSESLDRRVTQPAFQRLLVAMGGVDKDNTTGQILDALADCDLPSDIKITVVMGPHAPWLEQVRRQAARMNPAIEVLVGVRDMARIMAESDLAIGAGGTTTWERCCLGLPSIVLVLAENQIEVAQALAAANASLNLGPLSVPSFAQSLQSALLSASDPVRLANLSENVASVCDGRGARRVTSQLYMNVPQVDSVYSIRLACMEDAKNVWLWRNADAASKYYKNQSVKPLKEHMDWFSKALGEANRVLLIVEREALPVGHVRFDRQAERRDCAEISVYVNPDFRGKGYGKDILMASMEFAETLGVTRFLAEIHMENIASRSVFSKAGFSLESCEGSFCSMAKGGER